MRVTEQDIVIRLKQDFRFFREKLAEATSQALLAPLVEKAFGKPLKVQTGASTPTVASPKPDVSHTPAPVVAAVSSDAPKVFAPVSDDRSQKINHIVAMFDGAVVEGLGE